MGLVILFVCLWILGVSFPTLRKRLRSWLFPALCKLGLCTSLLGSVQAYSDSNNETSTGIQNHTSNHTDPRGSQSTTTRQSLSYQADDFDSATTIPAQHHITTHADDPSQKAAHCFWAMKWVFLCHAIVVCGTSIYLPLQSEGFLQTRSLQTSMVSVMIVGVVFVSIDLIVIQYFHRSQRRSKQHPRRGLAILTPVSLLGWPLALQLVDQTQTLAAGNVNIHQVELLLWSSVWAMTQPVWAVVASKAAINRSCLATQSFSNGIWFLPAFLLVLLISVVTEALRKDTIWSLQGLYAVLLMVHVATFWTFLTPLLESFLVISQSEGSPYTADRLQETIALLKMENERLKKKASNVATLAHEVRTPLNAMISACTLLQDTQLTSQQAEYLRLLSTCGSQISNNVNFVLELARFESGKVALECRPFNVHHLCKEVLATVRYLADAKNLQLVLLCAQTVPLLRGDPIRLSQALQNLLTNAIKFTESGSVTLRANVVVGPHPQFSQDPRASSISVPSIVYGAVRFEVSDTGIGLSPDQQAKLFQPFAQASSETQMKFGGTGLGLTITQQIIQMMRGGVFIDPTRTSLGVGTTVIVELHLPVTMMPHTPSSLIECHPNCNPMQSSPSTTSVASRRLHDRQQQAALLSGSITARSSRPQQPPLPIRSDLSPTNSTASRAGRFGSGSDCAIGSQQLGSLPACLPNVVTNSKPRDHRKSSSTSTTAASATFEKPVDNPLSREREREDDRSTRAGGSSACMSGLHVSLTLDDGRCGSPYKASGPLFSGEGLMLPQTPNGGQFPSSLSTPISVDLCRRPMLHGFSHSDSGATTTKRLLMGSASVASPPVTLAPEVPVVEENWLKKLKVLIVEDNLISGALMVRILASVGIDSVVHVLGADDAVEYIQQHSGTSSALPQEIRFPFDVIFTDLHLRSAMDGFGLATFVRQQCESMAVPRASIAVIGLSGDADPDTPQRCIQAGMNTFMLKPVLRDSLVAVLKSVCQKDQPSL